MMRWFDRLNLAPTERRLAIIGICVVALLLNYWLIWPYFSEWGQVDRDWTKLEAQKTLYFKEVSKKASYEKLLRELEGAGGQVLPEDQANRLQSSIIAAASTNGVNIGRVTPQIASLRMGAAKDTNFFDEQIVVVDLTAKEEGLVNFLYALGASDSMIRVRDMSRLRLDASGQNLSAAVTFVASFQKASKPASTRTGTATAVPSTSPKTSPAAAGQKASTNLIAVTEQPGFFKRIWNSIAGGDSAPAKPVQPPSSTGGATNAPAKFKPPTTTVTSRANGTNTPTKK